MMRQQTELMLEHKAAQTTQMNEIQRLIGNIYEKIQRITKRQDWLETRLDRVDTDLAYVSSELEKFDTCQRNTVPVDVECLEARLDVVENRTNRFGERIEMIQKELVPKLKESVVEELLVQINLKETKKQKLEIGVLKSLCKKKLTTREPDKLKLPFFHHPKGDISHLQLSTSMAVVLPQRMFVWQTLVRLGSFCKNQRPLTAQRCGNPTTPSLK